MIKLLFGASLSLLNTAGLESCPTLMIILDWFPWPPKTAGFYPALYPLSPGHGWEDGYLVPVFELRIQLIGQVAIASPVDDNRNVFSEHLRLWIVY